MYTNSENIRWLIRFKSEALIANANDVIKNFKHTDQEKQKAFQQLYIICDILAGELSYEQFGAIFRILYTNMSSFQDNKEIVAIIKLLAQSLGRLELDNTIFKIKEFAVVESSKSAVVSLYHVLHLLENILIDKPCITDMDKVLQIVMSLFEEIQSNLLDNNKLSQVAYNIIRTLSSICRQRKTDNNGINPNELYPRLFQLTVSFYGLINENDLEQVIQGFSLFFDVTPDQFIRQALSTLLQNLFTEKSYLTWENTSIDRIKFNSIIRHSFGISLQFLDIVLSVLVEQVKIDKDIQTRFDALELFNHIIRQSGQSNALLQFSDMVLMGIIKESMVWKMGKPNNKIRKAGSYCLNDMFKAGLVSSESVIKNFTPLLPILKGCLNDDWAPDLRYSTVVNCKNLLDLVRADISRDQCEEFYLCILERLDDAEDDLRIMAAETLSSLFQCKNFELSNSLNEYILKALFIHYDDSNENLQSSVHGALRSFAIKKKNMVLDQARLNITKLRYPENCESLIQELAQS